MGVRVGNTVGDTTAAANPQSSILNFQFSKKERLCSEKLIEVLFRSGHRMMVFPYSIHWQLVDADMLPSGTPSQVLIATSKKKFHHAVDRNRVKRLTRECYRLHKPQLYEYLENNGLSLILAINYVHNEIFDFATLMHKFDKLTAALIDSIEHAMPSNTSSGTPCQ